MSEEVIRSGHKRCDSATQGKFGDIGVEHIVQMVERCGSEIQKRFQRTCGELSDMSARLQSVFLRSGKDLLCLFDAERILFTKDINELSEFLLCGFRHHLLADKTDIVVALVLKFRR